MKEKPGAGLRETVDSVAAELLSLGVDLGAEAGEATVAIGGTREEFERALEKELKGLGTRGIDEDGEAVTSYAPREYALAVARALESLKAGG